MGIFSVPDLNQTDRAALISIFTDPTRFSEIPMNYSSDISWNELALIEHRCRLKAEGARWTAERQRMITRGASFSLAIAPKDKELIARAKALSDCYLWMSGPNAPVPLSIEHWDDVAGCFQVVADGLCLVQEIKREGTAAAHLFNEALAVLAKAQSALRQSVKTVGGFSDTDQAQVYQWIRNTTAEERLFVERHLKADDPAEPDIWRQVIAELEATEDELRLIQNRRQRQDSLFQSVLDVVDRIQSDEGAPNDWSTLISAVDELVLTGLPPSNIELRSLLLPVIGDMPDISNVPASFVRVRSEIERFIGRGTPKKLPKPKKPNPEIEIAANFIRGRSVVLVGGVPRKSALDALEFAFRPKELMWVNAEKAPSPSICDPYIKRPDVAMVWLAIRWARYVYTDYLRNSCVKHGKSFVLLPGGYNPDQVAHQIVAQLGL